jgi:hypothetical protein
MPIQVEVFAAEGVAIGVVERSGHLRDALEAGDALRVEQATWHPLVDDPPRPAGEVDLPPDDIYVASADEVDEIPVHAQWHDIALEVGPYRVTGQMPTMPGFDPGRALARPTGEFVQLRDVSIGLLSEAAGTGLDRAMALVNRYVVDRVEADLMLGFFFPGAVMIHTGAESPADVTPPTPAAPAASSPQPAT